LLHDTDLSDTLTSLLSYSHITCLPQMSVSTTITSLPAVRKPSSCLQSDPIHSISTHHQHTSLPGVRYRKPIGDTGRMRECKADRNSRSLAKLNTGFSYSSTSLYESSDLSHVRGGFAGRVSDNIWSPLSLSCFVAACTFLHIGATSSKFTRGSASTTECSPNVRFEYWLNDKTIAIELHLESLCYLTQAT
jgi:hypothetical protein